MSDPWADFQAQRQQPLEPLRRKRTPHAPLNHVFIVIVLAVIGLFLVLTIGRIFVRML